MQKIMLSKNMLENYPNSEIKFNEHIIRPMLV